MKKFSVILLIIALLLTLSACSKEISEEQNPISTPNDSETVKSNDSIGESNESDVIESVWTVDALDGIKLYEVYEFGGGLVGIGGGQLYFSADGINWEMTKDLSPYYYSSVFTANGQLVVYDDMNAHFTSDGRSYSSSPREVFHLFNTAMHDGNQFICVDTGLLRISQDGLKYINVLADPNNPISDVYFKEDSGYDAVIYRLALYKGSYYAVGDGIWKSSDLYTWERVVPLSSLVYTAEDLLYNGSTFLIPALYEFYIYDGNSSLTKTSPGASNFIINNGAFLAYNGKGLVNMSTDGITWTEVFKEDTNIFTAYCGIVYNEKLFIYGEDGKFRYTEYK
jgi:hypothetical protein